MSEAEGFTPTLYVCKGRTFSRDEQKLWVVLAPIDGDGALGSAKYYALGPNTRWLRAAATYEIPSNETRIQATNAKYKGIWEDKTQAAQWQLESQAAEAEDEMNRAHKRDADGRRELLELMRPLREAYGKSVATSRRLAIEMAVLNALRAPVKEMMQLQWIDKLAEGWL